MKWSLAVGRAWKLPVVWAAESEPQAAIAEPPQVVVHVHYYVPAPGIGAALPQPREAITEGNT